MTGQVTLGDVAERRMGRIEIVCDRCGRRGRWRLSRLLQRHGTGKGLGDLLDEATADCPRATAIGLYDRCRAHFVGLERETDDPPQPSSAPGRT